MDLVYFERSLASMHESSRKKLKRFFAQDDEDQDSNYEQPLEKHQRFSNEKMSMSFLENVPSKARAKILRRNMPKIFADDDDEEESHENDVKERIDIENFSMEREEEEGRYGLGFKMEPCKLNKEDTEGYFDNIEKAPMERSDDADDGGNEMELCEEDNRVLRRRIANVLEPGETVLLGLKRLKGKENMMDEAKRVINQLTEDAEKLFKNGDFNVYLKEQEVFEKDAKGLARLGGYSSRGFENNI